MRYSLSPNVFAHLDETNVVWLDIRQDRYIWQNRAEVLGLAPLVRGWPPDPPGQASAANSPLEIVSQLLTAGLITECVTANVPAPQLPHADLDFDTREGGAWVTPHHVLIFLWACIRAIRAERDCFESVIKRVRHLKSKASEPWTSTNLEAARAHMRTFRAIRLYVYDARLRCVFDSLVVTEYLAHFGLHPTFVIGVQTDPFGAHCWVQAGNYIFNDKALRTRYFSPILVI